MAIRLNARYRYKVKCKTLPDGRTQQKTFLSSFEITGIGVTFLTHNIDSAIIIDWDLACHKTG